MNKKMVKNIETVIAQSNAKTDKQKARLSQWQ